MTRIQAAWRESRAIGDRMKALGDEMEIHGRKMEALGRQMEQLSPAASDTSATSPRQKPGSITRSTPSGALR